MDEKEKDLLSSSQENLPDETTPLDEGETQLLENEVVQAEDVSEEEITSQQNEVKQAVEFEDNDNWQFDAEAPALDDSFFESTLDDVAPAPETQTSPEQDNFSDVNETQEQTEDTPSPEKLKKKKLIQIIICAVLIAAILVTSGIGAGYVYYNRKPVATIGSVKIDRGMYSYYYTNIVNYYEQYASEAGLDTTKDYKTIYTTDEDGNQVSWYDFFKNTTYNELEMNYKYYVAALDAGLTINKDGQKTVDDYVAKEKEGNTEFDDFDDYLHSKYGKYCNERTIIEFYEQILLANMYKGYFAAQQVVDDSQINDYLNEHLRDYQQINVRFIALPYDETSEETKAKSEKEVKKYMDKISDEKSLLALVPEVYASYIEEDVKSSMDSYSQLSAEDKKEYDKQNGGALTKEQAKKEATEAYRDGTALTISSSFAPFSDEINDWLFDEKTPVNSKDYAVISENGYAYILLKTEQPTFDEAKTYSVRHLLVQPQTDDETKKEKNEYTVDQWKAAEKKAKKILDEFNKGDKTEFSFALLAEEKTDDTASKSAALQGYYGGLYECISEDENMAEEFKNWALDSSRKYGDTEIVKTQFGYHIMFFVNQLPMYKANVVLSIKDEALEKSVENNKLEVNDKTADQVIAYFYDRKSAASSENTSE